MVVYCTVCMNNNRKNKNISYFNYPKEYNRRYDWLKAVGREDLLPTLVDYKTRQQYRICEDHFERNCIKFSKNGTVKYLFDYAFPTLKLLSKESVQENTFPTVNLPLNTSVNLNQFENVSVQEYQPSTSPTTSQQNDSQKKRKVALPEAKTIIANVYDFLQAEYENLKSYTGGSCDFSPLANIVKRTAAATRVSEATVKEILEERSSEEYARESVSRKRAKVTHDFEDEDVSTIEEDSGGESADDAQHGDGESNIDIEEHPIETLKVEIDDSEEYHSEANHGILFQIQPLSTQQLSAIHQSLPLTAPAHVTVKQEPVDDEDHEQLGAGDAVKDTTSFNVPICEATSAVHHLLRSNLEATSEPTKNVDQHMEFSTTSTSQAGRQPD
ncbi:unnamed protein product [Arctia plantaginis]|uniref:THAP-type domain-containing protein n=1 Tax=Arctia plantaginis TaxID=874455 RepID=A0A8S1BJ03_ARCPL|nr:unnamed protein product [Arctia plantaginis]